VGLRGARLFVHDPCTQSIEDASMSTCPFCLEDTKDGAKKCPHCQSDLVKDQDQSRKVVYILDQGLVTFAKFALVLFGLFAVVLYTVLGFHVEDSVKQIDEKSKAVAELQAKAKDISLEIQKNALSDQRELQRWKDELQRDRTFVVERTKEIEGIKSEVERIKTDSDKAFSEVHLLRADFEKYVDVVKGDTW
jgi:hypothetical protein